MNYVKHFNINGVNTKQAACIELHGKPNAATEGYVGVLGIDVDSPSHDVYKCVAVNGSIYTWELLSSGMSIMTAKTSGEGEASVQFLYTDLNTPAAYVVKTGDLILDNKGYLYQVSALNSTYCAASYCGIEFSSGKTTTTTRLKVEDDKLYVSYDEGKNWELLVTLPQGNNGVTPQFKMDEDGNLCVSYDEGNTWELLGALLQGPEGPQGPRGPQGAPGNITIDGNTELKFFVGTQEDYEKLSDDVKKSNLLAIITDDPEDGSLIAKINGFLDGSIPVPSAEKAEQATSDGNGENIAQTYVRKDKLTDGTVAAKRAICNGAGENIDETYVRKNEEKLYSLGFGYAPWGKGSTTTLYNISEIERPLEDIIGVGLWMRFSDDSHPDYEANFHLSGGRSMNYIENLVKDRKEIYFSLLSSAITADGGLAICSINVTLYEKYQAIGMDFDSGFYKKISGNIVDGDFIEFDISGRFKLRSITWCYK